MLVGRGHLHLGYCVRVHLPTPPSLPALPGGVGMRLLEAADPPALARAYRDDREQSAPWEPARDDAFFTPEGQAAVVARRLEARAAGTDVPWVIVVEDRIIGTITLNGIVRGPLLSGHVGYWVDSRFQGRGICSAALASVLQHAREELGLHRVQASVMPRNAPSQAVLHRAGFTLIGLAPSYLRIAGAWEDHLLYQRILH